MIPFSQDSGRTSKAFLRLLIEYSTVQQNKALAYVGITSLGIVQIFDVYNESQSADSALELSNIISRNFIQFLCNNRGVFDIPEIDGLAAWMIVINALINTASRIFHRENASFRQTLEIIKESTEHAVLHIDSFLRHGSNNEALKITKTCLSVIAGGVVVGDAVKIIYDVFNGNALSTLSDNLRRYLPKDVSSVVEKGVFTALQFAPVAGGLVASAEIRAVEKNLLAQINKAEQNICSRIDQVGFQLSSQIHIGFTILNHHVFEIKSQLKDIKDNLLKLQRMMNQQNDMIRDLNLIKPISRHNKKIKNTIKSREIKVDETFRINELYEESLGYLSPGDTEEEAFPSVYSKYMVADWLKVLFQFASNKYQTQGANIVLPNFNMWLQTITALMKFISDLRERNLFQPDYFDIDSLLLIFDRSMEISKFLKYLTTSEFRDDMFAAVLAREVNTLDLYKLAYYCSLVGIPLVGFGEDIKFWDKNDDACLVFRQEIVCHLKQIMQTNNRNTVISDAISATNHVALSLGYLLTVIAEESTDSLRHNKYVAIKEKVAQTLYDNFYINAGTNKQDISYLCRPKSLLDKDESNLDSEKEVSIDSDTQKDGARWYRKPCMFSTIAVVGSMAAAAVAVAVATQFRS